MSQKLTDKKRDGLPIKHEMSDDTIWMKKLQLTNYISGKKAIFKGLTSTCADGFQYCENNGEMTQ